jgi:hypothetical protein
LKDDSTDTSVLTNLFHGQLEKEYPARLVVLADHNQAHRGMMVVSGLTEHLDQIDSQGAMDPAEEERLDLSNPRKRALRTRYPMLGTNGVLGNAHIVSNLVTACFGPHQDLPSLERCYVNLEKVTLSRWASGFQIYSFFCRQAFLRSTRPGHFDAFRNMGANTQEYFQAVCKDTAKSKDLMKTIKAALRHLQTSVEEAKRASQQSVRVEYLFMVNVEDEVDDIFQEVDEDCCPTQAIVSLKSNIVSEHLGSFHDYCSPPLTRFAYLLEEAGNDDADTIYNAECKTALIGILEELSHMLQSGGGGQGSVIHHVLPHLSSSKIQYSIVHSPEKTELTPLMMSETDLQFGLSPHLLPWMAIEMDSASPQAWKARSYLHRNMLYKRVRDPDAVDYGVSMFLRKLLLLGKSTTPSYLHQLQGQLETPNLKEIAQASVADISMFLDEVAQIVIKVYRLEWLNLITYRIGKLHGMYVKKLVEKTLLQNDRQMPSDMNEMNLLKKNFKAMLMDGKHLGRVDIFETKNGDVITEPSALVDLMMGNKDQSRQGWKKSSTSYMGHGVIFPKFRSIKKVEIPEETLNFFGGNPFTEEVLFIFIASRMQSNLPASEQAEPGDGLLWYTTATQQHREVGKALRLKIPANRLSFSRRHLHAYTPADEYIQTPDDDRFSHHILCHIRNGSHIFFSFIDILYLRATLKVFADCFAEAVCLADMVCKWKSSSFKENVANCLFGSTTILELSGGDLERWTKKQWKQFNAKYSPKKWLYSYPLKERKPKNDGPAIAFEAAMKFAATHKFDESLQILVTNQDRTVTEQQKCKYSSAEIVVLCQEMHSTTEVDTRQGRLADLVDKGILTTELMSETSAIRREWTKQVRAYWNPSTMQDGRRAARDAVQSLIYQFSCQNPEGLEKLFPKNMIGSNAPDNSSSGTKPAAGSGLINQSVSRKSTINTQPIHKRKTADANVRDKSTHVPKQSASPSIHQPAIRTTQPKAQQNASAVVDLISASSPLRSLLGGKAAALKSSDRLACLKQFGEMKEVPADGSCGYHAVMMGLQGLSIPHADDVATFRKSIYDHAVAKEEWFRARTGSQFRTEGSWGRHWKNNVLNSLWTDLVNFRGNVGREYYLTSGYMLPIIAHKFQVDIVCVDGTSNELRTQGYSPAGRQHDRAGVGSVFGQKNSNIPCLLILFVGNDHFNFISPKLGGTDSFYYSLWETVHRPPKDNSTRLDKTK